MRLKSWQILALLVLLGVYTALCFFIFSHQARLDFSSLYSACQAMVQNENPYQMFWTTYLPVVRKLPVNLNPPAALWLFTPLVRFSYDHALLIWVLSSLLFTIWGGLLAFYHAFPRNFFKQHWLSLLLLMLSAFSIMMNMAIAQLGALLLFLLMLGFHYYVKQQSFPVALCWGIAIALKLFPGLLLLWLLLQRQYRLLAYTSLVVLFCYAMPFLLYGSAVYTQYGSMFSRVAWFGDSWNASLYGYLFRLLINPPSETGSLLFLQGSYGVIALVMLGRYIHITTKAVNNQQLHTSFSYTLVLMLFLSPLGWLYYFPILVFPLAVIWWALVSQNQSIQGLWQWLLAVFLLNFPMGYKSSFTFPPIFEKLTLYSFHFYGLLLLVYLAATCRLTTEKTRAVNPVLCDPPVYFAIFSFGIFILIINFLKKI